MKKLLLTLGIASGLALMPTGVQAINQTDNGDGSCNIVVSAGETATINYSTNCNVINNGNLTIAEGAHIENAVAGKSNIVNNGTLTINSGIIKKTSHRDSTAPITNYGTITMNAGYIEGDYGIMHNGGKITINNGSIRSWLYPSIWAKNSSPVYIYNGTFKFPIDWVAVWSKGKVNICGGTFTGGDKISEHATLDTSTCPQPAAPATPAPQTTTETPVQQPVATAQTATNQSSQKVAKETVATIPEQKVAVAEEPKTTEEIIAKEDAIISGNDQTPTTEPATETSETKTEEEQNNKSIVVEIILGSLILIGGASAIFIITRK